MGPRQLPLVPWSSELRPRNRLINDIVDSHTALLQLEGPRKRLNGDIVDFVANKLEDPWQLQGPIYEQALRLVWYEREIDGSTNQDELQRWLVSLRENPRQFKSIFGFYKPGGIFYEGNNPPSYKTHY